MRKWFHNREITEERKTVAYNKPDVFVKPIETNKSNRCQLCEGRGGLSECHDVDEDQ